jgi:two-component system sensor histidine kinase TctE
MTYRELLLRWSLRRTALILLVPVLVVVGGIELLTTYRTVSETANSAYDRSLLGAIRATDANISTASGGVSVELPYTMLEFFQLTAAGRVHFRVYTEDGLTEVGSADLPPPPAALKTRVPLFYDAEYFGEKVRVGAYARYLDRPIGNTRTTQRVVIQVAESVASRNDFVKHLIVRAAGRDIAMLVMTGGMLVFVLAVILRPLAQLGEEVRARSPFDIHPVDAASVPLDVRPLVDAINSHMARSQHVIEARRRFIDDASHQLRTPLATLRTQMDYALRESDPNNIRAALEAVSRQLDDATHRTIQLLSLARADAAALKLDAVDLAQEARKSAREAVPLAREKRIDLEFDGPEDAVMVLGNAGMLREAILNLLHNAIRFAPTDGRVVVVVRNERDAARISVTDNGSGIPPDQLPRLGERFFRASNTVLDGSGLGLAISRSVAEQCGGKLTIANTIIGTGCVATMLLLYADADRQEIDSLVCQSP